MTTLAEPDINVKLFKARRRHDLDKKLLPEPRIPLTTDDSEKWEAVCVSGVCSWKRDGFSSVESASTAAHAHSADTLRKTGAAHRVLPRGVVSMRGEIVVAGDDQLQVRP